MSSTIIIKPRVHLEVYEYSMAMDIAKCRQYSSMKSERLDVAGLDASKPLTYKAQMEGVCAEVAVSKHLGVYWDGSVDTFHTKPDVMDFIEVKWCGNEETPFLVIRPSSKEKKGDAFVLVTGDLCNYVIWGWRTRQWVEENIPLTRGGDSTRPDAYFCPAKLLLPMSELLPEVANRFLAALLGADACVASRSKLNMLLAPSVTPVPVRPVDRRRVFEQEPPHPAPGKPRTDHR